MLKNDRWRTKTRVGKITGALLMLLFISSLVALALPPYLEIEDQNLGAGNIPIPPADGSTAIVQEIFLSDYEEIVQTESAQPVHIIEIAVDSLGTANAEDIAFIRILKGPSQVEVGGTTVSSFPVTVCSGIDLVIPDGAQDTLWVEVTLSGNASHGDELQLQTWIKYWEDRQDNPRWGFATDGAPETLKDVTPPTDPDSISSVPVKVTWSNDNTVEVTWSGASDTGGSELDGYSIEWSTNSSTTPDAIIEVPQASDPHSATSSELDDDDDHWFHLCTCDTAENCTNTVHWGPFKIDTQAPEIPGNRSPDNGAVTNDTSPTFSWSAPSDPGGSGVKSYRVYIDDEPLFSSPRVKEETIYDLDYSPDLYEDVFYWKLYAKDNAGNTGDWSEVWSLVIDTTPPTGTVSVTPGTLSDDSLALTVQVTYDEPMNDGSTPTITFGTTTGAISSNSDGSWDVTGPIWTETFNLADANEERTGVTVSSSGATDVAGNAEGACVQDTFNIDTKNPTPTVTVDTDPIYEGDLIQKVTVIYDEAMDQTSTPTISLVGAGSNFTGPSSGWVSSTQYEATFTHDGTQEEIDGAIACVTAGGAKDLVGNTDNGDDSPAFEIDTEKPTVTGVTVDTDPVYEGDLTQQVTVTYSEVMTTDGSANPTITFDHGTWDSDDNGTWSGGDTWTEAFTLTDKNEEYTGVQTTVNSDTAKDAAGNDQVSYTETTNVFDIDTVRPAVTVNQAAGQQDPANTLPIAFDVVFSSVVVDFDASDVTMGGTATGVTFNVSGPSPGYNINVTAVAGDGTLEPTIAENVVHDEAGNGNFASTSTDNSVLYDSTAPVISGLTVTGGNVDENCEKSVTFVATVTDNYCVSAANVDVNVTLPSANATLGTPTITKTQVSVNQVTVSGHVLVSDLTGCPATVQVTIDADDCYGNHATQASSSGDVTDTTVPVISGLTVTGGNVDENCEKSVTFVATVTDNCCVSAANVDVNVTLPSANATLGTPTITKTQVSVNQVTVSGHVLVSDLTGCPATVQVTIDADDCYGNHATQASSSGDVTDTTVPVISGLTVTGGNVDENCEKSVTFVATVTDNCCVSAANVDVNVTLPSANATLGTPTITKTQVSVNQVTVSGHVLVSDLTGCPATVQVTIDADDCCDNSATQASSSGDVNDTIAPVISGLTVSDETVDASCEATVEFSATVTDNCCVTPGGVTVVVTLPTGNATLGSPTINEVQNGQGQVDVTGSVLVSNLTGCPATVQVTIDADDCCGNHATQASATATIMDTTAPTFNSPPEDVLVLEDEIPSPPTLTASDNCDNDVDVVYEQIGGATGSSYTLERKWTATDDCGNSTVHSQGVSVLVIPDDVTVECGESTDPDDTGTIDELDNEFIDTVVEYDDSEDGTCPTVITRTWTVTDEDDWSKSVEGEQTITVEDTTPPVITCPADLTLECDPATNADDIDAWLASFAASDVCGEVTITNDYEGLSGGCSEGIGSAVVTFTATDECDNESTCQATVTVVDATPPSITTQASDLTVECDGAGNTAQLNAWLDAHAGAVASDVCCGTDITWSHNFTALSDDCGATGSVTVTFTATDCCGLTSTTQATFTIEDTTPPSITTQASDLTVECDGAGNTTELTNWLDGHAGAVASDVCCGTDVTWSHNYTALSDDCGATGLATVTFTATDCCGLTSTTQATFTIVDTTPPSITTQASDLTVECDGAGNTTELTNWLDGHAGAVASDVCCGTDVTWSHNYTALSDDCGATGLATVTFTATDCCGLTSTTQATFTIVDTTPPEITCPEDVTVSCDAGTCEATEVDLGMATATDNCDPSPSLSNDAPGVFPLGETVVTWTATDACGNSSVCTQLVTVIDQEAPTVAFTQVPTEVSSDPNPHFEWAGSDNCTALENLLFSTQFDGGAWSAFSHTTSADIGPLEDGDHTFQVRATDAAGNSGTSEVDTFTIASERPVVAITSPPSGWVTGTSELEVAYTISGTNLSSAEFLHNGTATAIAPEDGSITITLTPGENTLEVTATNTAGTASSGTVTVTYDITPPVVEITAPLDDQVLGVNACTVTGTVDDPDVSEVTLLVNGIGEAVSVIAGAFIRELIGLIDGETYEIEAQATDAVGNTGSSGVVTIRVNTSQPIVAITSPPSGLVTGMSELEVTYVIGGVDLSSATFLHNGAATAIAPVNGSITITLTAGDNALEVRATNVAGTSSSGTVTVTYDIIPPVVKITAPLDGQVLGVNACTVTGTVDDPDVSEVTLLVNGVAEVISLASPFTKELTGLTDGATYEIEARATDTVGNTGSSGVVMIRVNTSQPVVAITSPPSGSVTGTSELEVTYEISGVDLSSAEFLHNGAATAIAPADGSITITLTPGENSLEVTATNVAGTSSSGVRIITYDTVPPVVEITSPADGTLVTVPSVEVTGTIDDPEVSYADLIVNGEAAAVISVVDGRFSYTVTLEQEGLNAVEVKATDACGNTGSSGTIGVDYDPGKPDVEVKHPTNGHLTNLDACAIDGTITHGAVITEATLYINGVAGPLSLTLESAEGGRYLYTFNTTATLVEGENALAVEATDEFGESGSSGTISVTLDTTAPVVAITAPVTGYLTNQEMVLVTGTVDDPAVGQVVLNVNGTEKTIAVAAGSFSREVSLIEGENTLEATASDSLGNEGSSGAVVVTYDSAAPAVSISSPATGTKTNSASMVVTYTIALEATSAEFILNGVSEEIPAESGSRSVSLVEGDNTLEVRASDGVNVGSSGVVRVILDETAPSVTVKLSEPAETILITVRSNEALVSPPTVEVTNGATTEVEMTLTDVREWTGSYTIPEDGSYRVEVSGTDEAGNLGSYSTSFSRESVSAAAGETITVERDQLRLDIEVSEDVSDQSIATTLYTKDPRSGVEPEAAIFVKVDMGIALQRAIVEMGIEAFYDPAKLPEGTDESTLKLYLWTPSKGGWSLVEGATVDTTEHSITGVVTY